MDRDQEQAKGAIETFIIDWPVLLFIGLLFGAFAPEVRPWSSRALRAGLVSSIVFTATAFISYVVAPDWMWMYFIEPDDAVWTLPLIAAGYLFTFALGFAAALGLRQLSRLYVFAAAAGALVAEVAVVALTWDRYRVVGSAREWATGSALPLLGGSPEGPVRVIAPLGPVFAVVLVVCLVLTLRSRRAPTADR